MSGKQILVCDDEPHIVHVVATKLRTGGFDVMTAPDGQEAFDLAFEHVPALIFTDYQMPHLSGLELCAKLRSDPRTKGIPIVMITARGYSMEASELKKNNIVQVLPKPFSPREILAIAQKYLQSSGKQPEIQKTESKDGFGTYHSSVSV